jgi:putative FmdB family regulatory protein
MPIYEYECQACQHLFEEWQKMSDKPITVCPKCNAEKVEKLISHTSFQLKGGGWYKDLYASPKASGSSSSDAGGAASTSTSSKDSGSPAAAPAAPASTPSDKGTKGASKAAA